MTGLLRDLLATAVVLGLLAVEYLLFSISAASEELAGFVLFWSLVGSIGSMAAAGFKGLNRLGWGALGIPFGPLAILAVAMTTPDVVKTRTVDRPAPEVSANSVATELERPKKLHEQGDINEREYAAANKQVLGSV